MKAKDFYLNQLKQGSVHDEKFLKGKNYYSDFLHSNLIKYCYLHFFKDKTNVKVLEIGTFTGRITRKLIKYFSNITLSDVNVSLIYSPSLKCEKIEIDLSVPFNNSAYKEKFDFVVSLGHQVSFSNNVKIALENLRFFLKKGGIALFDIWNKNYLYNPLIKPPYEFETASISEVYDAVNKWMNICEIIYGPRLNWILGKYSNYLIEKLVRKGNIGSKWYCSLERLFQHSTSKFLLSRTQTLIFIGRKNEIFCFNERSRSWKNRRL